MSNTQFYVELYCIVGGALTAAKLADSAASNSVCVLIGITWPLYVYLFVLDFIQRRQKARGSK